MKNAHLRLAQVEYSVQSKNWSTRVQVWCDRLATEDNTTHMLSFSATILRWPLFRVRSRPTHVSLQSCLMARDWNFSWARSPPHTAATSRSQAVCDP